MPTFSIIMPIYNACQINDKYLLEALESIRNQTYQDIELIIVNDGSIDKSEKVIKDYISHHPEICIQYYYKENGGQSHARNFGANFTRGEYLCFLDQDDLWAENKLELITSQLDEDTDLLYTDADIIDEEGETIAEGIHKNYKLGAPHPKRCLEDILFKDVAVMPGVMTVKKDIFKTISGFDENLSGYEDDDLFLRIFEIGKIKYLPVSTLKWRHHSGNCILMEGIIKSRLIYWRKLIINYTDNGQDLFRIRKISSRFFKEILHQALIQYKKDNMLYLANIATAKEIMPSLPGKKRILFRLLFLLNDRPMINIFRIYLLLERVIAGNIIRLRRFVRKFA
ncbi:MAG: hypothetical protein A2Y79_09920 [Deltaproteobacteria bacterium RBG_13_43_22]|nr:MAG: hypothetical protein A2Y79_09920 [Deltaproteobacteria bacterium RBG_13_43_22]